MLSHHHPQGRNERRVEKCREILTNMESEEWHTDTQIHKTTDATTWEFYKLCMDNFKAVQCVSFLASLEPDCLITHNFTIFSPINMHLLSTSYNQGAMEKSGAINQRPLFLGPDHLNSMDVSPATWLNTGVHSMPTKHERKLERKVRGKTTYDFPIKIHWSFRVHLCLLNY